MDTTPRVALSPQVRRIIVTEFALNLLVLSENIKDYDRDAVHRIPRRLGLIGEQIYRIQDSWLGRGGRGNKSKSELAMCSQDSSGRGEAASRKPVCWTPAIERSILVVQSMRSQSHGSATDCTGYDPFASVHSRRQA